MFRKKNNQEKQYTKKAVISIEYEDAVSHMHVLTLQCALATPLDQLCFLLATALSVTLAMVIVPANLAWLVLSVIGVW